MANAFPDNQYPDWYEEKGSRQLTFNNRGAFGKRIWIATWENRFKAAPLLGTPYSVGYGNIRCNEVSFEPMEKTGDGHAYTVTTQSWAGTSSGPDTMDYSHCRITATYEYELLTGDEPQISGDCSTEIINIGQGRYWEGTVKPTLNEPTPVEEPTPVMLPGLAVTFRIVRYIVPIATIFAYTGKINNAMWYNAAPETMLYEGATWDSDYDAQTGQLRWVVQHRFRWRYFGWNKMWRPPHQQCGADGTPVFDADGFPVYDVTAEWDRPLDIDGNGLYLTANFDDLML